MHHVHHGAPRHKRCVVQTGKKQRVCTAPHRVSIDTVRGANAGAGRGGVKTQSFTEKGWNMVSVQKSAKRRQSFGETHWKADLSDHEVELMRSLHDEGWGYRRLAAKFEIPRDTVRSIVNYRTRCR